MQAANQLEQSWSMHLAQTCEEHKADGAQEPVLQSAESNQFLGCSGDPSAVLNC